MLSDARLQLSTIRRAARRAAWDCTMGLLVLALLLPARSSCAQSIDDLLDTQRYFEGLSELYLPEVLEHYIATHPTDDPAIRAQYAIAQQRMSMRRPDVNASERAELLRRVAEIRRSLIDSRPEDPRRASWLADQSATWLFELFNIETSGWTALLGAPSDRQRAIASEAARKAYELAAQASDALQQRLLAIERQPGFIDDVAAQLERQRLIERERRRRLPLLRGISTVAHAELNVADAAERARLYESAVDELRHALESVDGAAACHARLHLAIAQWRLGAYDAALEALQPVEDRDACGADLPMLAALVRANVIGSRDGPQAALQQLAGIEQQHHNMNLLHRVLLTDRTFAWRKTAAQAQTDEAKRRQLMAAAYRVYLELLNADISEPDAVVRAVVINRLANVAESDAPDEQLPALVTVAVAEAQARDPETRSRAIELLQSVLDRPDVDDPDRAAALFTLGRALHEDGRTLDAARRLTELARAYPADAQAEQAIETAVSLALGAFERVRSSGAVRNVLREALDVLLNQYPKLAVDGRWRYAAGELAVYEQRWDDAARQFSAIDVVSDYWLDAQFMLGNVARLRAEAVEDNLNRISANENAVEVIRGVRPAIEQALARGTVEQERRQALRYYLVYLKVFEARSLLELTDAQQALSVLDQIELDESLEPEARADVLLTRINAHQALGRAGEAQQELRAYLEAAPHQIGTVLPPMMMEIEREVRELLKFGLHDEAQAKAERELLPLANLLADWMEQHPDAPTDEFALRRRMAAAFELSGSYHQALLEYDRLLVTHPNLLPLLVGKAEALYHLGGEDRLAEAMTLFKRIGAFERDDRSSTYWLAQLRMLQILDQVGRNTDQIMPRIEQLQQRDPQLGGERWQAQFNALRRKYR